MSPSVLSDLKSDHRLFNVLLDAAAAQVDALEVTCSADTALLQAISGYFENYPRLVHHPLEEVIYGHLTCYMPGFADDVYGLIEDHRETAARAQAFRKATERLDVHDPDSRRDYVPLVRAFIENERAHLTAEEQLFFPYAERMLSHQQWAEVSRAANRQNAISILKAAIDAFPQLRHMLTPFLRDRDPS